MLEIKNLNVKINEQDIIKNLTYDFSLKNGNLFVLLGPNGCGKSTLFKAIMGFSGYEVNGDILFNGIRINELSIDQRVKLGVTYMYQHPPKIKGVKMKDILEEKGVDDDFWSKFSKNVDDLDASKFYSRYINDGLSGGEVKRSELLTLTMFGNSKLFLFDEPDSGVDLDNLKKIGGYISNMVKESNGIGIIITHTGDILRYLDSHKALIMYEGKIACEGNPDKILDCIKKYGYQRCVNCKSLKV